MLEKLTLDRLFKIFSKFSEFLIEGILV